MKLSWVSGPNPWQSPPRVVNQARETVAELRDRRLVVTRKKFRSDPMLLAALERQFGYPVEAKTQEAQ